MTLQLSLALAGLILFVSVYVISRWQSERHLPKTRSRAPQLGDEPDPPPHPPMPPDDEPFAGRGDESYDEHADAAGDEPEHRLLFHPKPRSKPKSEPQSDLTAQNISGFSSLGQIDYWVLFRSEREVSRDAVLAVFREAATPLTHHHAIYGLLAPGGEWRSLVNEPEEARFTDLVVALQLADLSGAVDSAEMRHFTNLVQRLSEATGRGFHFMAEVPLALKQAAALAEFIRRYERTLFLLIQPPAGRVLSGTLVQHGAAGLGMDADDEGFFTRYKLVEKRRVALYRLGNVSDNGQFDWEKLPSETFSSVTFFTYPALHAKPAAVFAEMVDTAKAFAARIKAELHSPYGELKAEQVETIRIELEAAAREMSAQGIKPGSEQAVRLFRPL